MADYEKDASSKEAELNKLIEYYNMVKSKPNLYISHKDIIKE